MRSLNDLRFIAWARGERVTPFPVCVYCGHDAEGEGAILPPHTCNAHDDLPAVDPHYQA